MWGSNWQMEIESTPGKLEKMEALQKAPGSPPAEWECQSRAE
jgi:hypothetical protein